MGVRLCTGVCNNKSQLNSQMVPDSKTSRGRIIINNAATCEGAEGVEESQTLTASFTQRSAGHRITAFHNAVAAGKESTSQFLLDENPKDDLVNCKNLQNLQSTPLMVAVQFKQYNMMHFLLEYNAKINEQNEFDETALHIATENADLEAVQLLCKYDVDQSLVNDKGETALDVALFGDGKEFRLIANVLEPDKEKLKQKRESGGMTSDRLQSFTNKVLLLSPGKTIRTENEEPNRALFTSHLTGVVDDLFADIDEDVEQKAKQLPQLQSWLEKKQASPPYLWQRRWVVCMDGFILWADRKIAGLAQPLTEKEKLRWNTVIPLTNVTTIEKVVDNTKDWKFVLKVKKRDYIFRCETQSLRDYWVAGVRQHCKLVEKAKLYSSQSTFGTVQS